MYHVNLQIHGSSLFYDTQLSIMDYIFMILVRIGAHHLSSDIPYTSRRLVRSPHSIYSIPSSCAIDFPSFSSLFPFVCHSQLAPAHPSLALSLLYPPDDIIQ